MSAYHRYATGVHTPARPGGTDTFPECRAAVPLVLHAGPVPGWASQPLVLHAGPVRGWASACCCMLGLLLNAGHLLEYAASRPRLRARSRCVRKCITKNDLIAPPGAHPCTAAAVEVCNLPCVVLALSARALSRDASCDGALSLNTRFGGVVCRAPRPVPPVSARSGGRS